MRDTDRDALIETLLHPAALDRSGHGAAGPVLDFLVVAAVIAAASDDLLRDALRLATTTADRQFVAIADAYRRGDHDRVDALARDHLLDHRPKAVLTWIVTQSRAAGRVDPDPV